MQAMLPLIDRDVCNQPQWHNNTVDDSMVCAGYEEGELGNCYVSENEIHITFPTLIYRTLSVLMSISGSIARNVLT